LVSLHRGDAIQHIEQRNCKEKPPVSFGCRSPAVIRMISQQSADYNADLGLRVGKSCVALVCSGGGGSSYSLRNSLAHRGYRRGRRQHGQAPRLQLISPHFLVRAELEAPRAHLVERLVFWSNIDEQGLCCFHLTRRVVTETSTPQQPSRTSPSDRAALSLITYHFCFIIYYYYTYTYLSRMHHNERT